MNITKIYLVTNCFGDPNKVYIGKTKTNYRDYYHKKRFGKDIIFTYIDEINSLNSKDWKPLECFWIEYFRQLGFDMQNKNNGGGGPEFYSQEIKDKIGQANKGNTSPFKNHTHSNIAKQKISNKLKGKPKPKGFGDMMREVRLGVPKPQGMGDKISQKLKGRENTWNSKPIIQLDMNGNFIKEWKNQTEAGLKTKTNRASISKVCRGKLNSTNNFKWKFKD